MSSIKKLRPLHVPPTPDLAVDDDFNAVADYLANTHGVPKGTVAFTMMAVIASLVSRRLQYSWQGYSNKLSMQIFLLDGMTEFQTSWLKFLIYPVAKVIAQKAGNAAKLEELHKTLESHRRSIKLTEGRQDLQMISIPSARRTWDEIKQTRLLMLPPGRGDYAYDHSPLLVGTDRQVVQSLNRPDNAKLRELLFCGLSAEFFDTCPYTVLCVSNRSDVRKFEQGHLGARLFPLILPQAGGQLKASIVDEEKVSNLWMDLVSWAATPWTVAGKPLLVDDNGAATLTRIKAYTESFPQAGIHPQRYSWVLSTCMTIAVIEHARRYDGPEINSKAWDCAERFTRWTIEAHSECMKHAGGSRFHPPRSDDMQRLANTIKANPNWSFRQLYRSLPKRQKNYWRTLYKRFEDDGAIDSQLQKMSERAAQNLANRQQTDQTRPTPPTSDGAGIRPV